MMMIVRVREGDVSKLLSHMTNLRHLHRATVAFIHGILLKDTFYCRMKKFHGMTQD